MIFKRKRQGGPGMQLLFVSSDKGEQAWTSLFFWQMGAGELPFVSSVKEEPECSRSLCLKKQKGALLLPFVSWDRWNTRAPLCLFRKSGSRVFILSIQTDGSCTPAHSIRVMHPPPPLLSLLIQTPIHHVGPYTLLYSIICIKYCHPPPLTWFSSTTFTSHTNYNSPCSVSGVQN